MHAPQATSVIDRRQFALGNPAQNVTVWLASGACGRNAADLCHNAMCDELGLPPGDHARRVENYDYMAARPGIKISRTHTQTVGGVVVAKSERPIGIGIDVEQSRRPLRAGIERHFLNVDDESEAFTHLLRAWVAKEAVYKALAPHQARWLTSNDPLLLSKCWIKAGQFGLLGDVQALGQYRIEEIAVDGQELLLGLAILSV